MLIQTELGIKTENQSGKTLPKNVNSITKPSRISSFYSNTKIKIRNYIASKNVNISRFYGEFNNDKIFPLKYFEKFFKTGRNFNMKLKIMVTSLILATIICSIVNYSFEGLKKNSRGQKIRFKTELSGVDLISLANKRDVSAFPISESILNDENYESYQVKGYITNLKLEGLISKKNSEAPQKQDTKGKLVTVKDLELLSSKDYKDLVECDDLEYEAKIFYSKEQKMIKDDLIGVRKYLLSKDFDVEDRFIAEHVQQENEKDKSDYEIVKKSWFRFGSSSVWMESEQCYITVTRLMYSSHGSKAGPDISLIRAQAFDRNWEEIKDKRIPKHDIQIPQNIDLEIEKLESDYSLTKDTCKIFIYDPTKYDTCIAEKNKIYFENKRRMQNIIDQYFVTYPTVYKFPMLEKTQFAGSEDPRIVLRKFHNQEEPVVVFNMDTKQNRKMHALFPHRKLNPLLELNFEGMNHMEKNWAPFFTDSDINTSMFSRGSIHFMYHYTPLEIVKCSLDDGICEKIFTKQTLGLTKKNHFGGIRGGTQFVQLPSIIPRIHGKQIFVGFSKLHIDDCGCGSKFYRPMLDVIIEEDGIYHQELIVPSLDFNIEVLDWSTKSHTCNFYNILSPNSIAFWDVIKQDPKTKKFEDLLVFTFSEADEVSKVINIKGLLEYILNLYSTKQIEENFIPSFNSDTILGETLQCVKSNAEQICKNYGLIHKAEVTFEK
ncbi:hypothetical protein TBLA_0B00700 [Henningerozyma blattae CBS 6284]|uniref:Glycosyltransferase family 91 protein n=1 Tax=Henningerozyma blattae (strain ATCC 34711 / CBS 6284 / DSM 70876 / NBRC 10599 / NRRL Y-10934 / UCD 77-7) TaxID=1071380 RepID=I2GXR1_HENB6|nr:hypothetical protein TBLA_0B00700 [Tetrapisispora blattae CBS 6284]CCH58913.1 hypothetical protein TBLA_0B00700 [Tetrapisispora blattae CBS 6284]